MDMCAYRTWFSETLFSLLVGSESCLYTLQHLGAFILCPQLVLLEKLKKVLLKKQFYLSNIEYSKINILRSCFKSIDTIQHLN